MLFGYSYSMYHHQSFSLRQTLGWLLIAKSCLLWLGVFVVPFTQIPSPMKTIGALYLASYLCWFLGLGLIGKEALTWLKNKMKGIWLIGRKQPPRPTVSSLHPNATHCETDDV